MAGIGHAGVGTPGLGSRRRRARATRGESQGHGLKGRGCGVTTATPVTYAPPHLARGNARQARLLWTAVVVTAGAAVAGIAMAASILTTADPDAGRVGDTMDTSFGSFTVDEARLLPAADLPMAMAGMSAPDMGHEDRVQVLVTLVNTGPAPVRYAHDQFRVVVEDGTTLDAINVENPGGSLMPRAAITLLLAFPLHDSDGQLRLEYREIGASAPTVVDLDTISHGTHDRATSHREVH